MQFFGRQNLPPSLLSFDQINAMRFSLLSIAEKTSTMNQDLPTKNALGSIFGDNKLNNGLKI